MTVRLASQRAACGGFTLFEALVATALMGLILSALATVTAQWLPNWDRGIVRAQGAETVAVALDRLVADLAASQFILPSRDSKQPLFDGREREVTFVRTSLGPNAQPGLEIVHIGETKDNRGAVLMRSRTVFAPFSSNAIAFNQLDFSDPIPLLRAPFHVVFAYAGPDGVYRDSWSGADTLPASVRVVVRNDKTQRTLAISTATAVHVDAPASIVCGSDGKCGDQKDDAAPAQPGQPGQPGGQPANGGGRQE